MSLAGFNVVIAYECPQRHMIEGNWIQSLIIDRAVSPDNSRRSKRLPTRRLSVCIDEIDKTKRVSVDGVLEASIEEIRGQDRSAPVMLQNMFNQIHATSQVIAAGSTTYDDGELRIDTSGTHALYSSFEWSN